MRVESCGFANLNLLFFLLFSLPSLSSDLKLPIIEESGDKESDGKGKKVLITANQPGSW